MSEISEMQTPDMIQRIGIDKIQFYGFGLDREDGIDYNRLMCHECISIEDAGTGIPCIRYHPITHKGIKKISIKDNQVFSDLVIGCSIKEQKPYEYIYLTITVDNARGVNLEPMSYEEYSRYLENVLEYIADEYGIHLHTDFMGVKYIEISTNILLSKKFSEYGRGFRLLMSFPDKRYGKLSTYEGVSKNKQNTALKGESYKRGNKSIELIFYDKTKQLEDLKKGKDTFDLPQYLRIEYRLLDQKKVKAELGTFYWKELNDRILYDWFLQKIQKQLFDQYEQWKQDCQKKLLKLIKKCRRRDPRKWHQLLLLEIDNISALNGISFILDIEQVYEAVRSIPNSSRYSSRSIHAIDSIKIDNDIYRNHDLDKIQEVINGVELAYKNSCGLVCC
ncbi:MAG: hypothetical protein NC548_32945 [Lachnospiraceae bacterium]|nr:hypothetical protein [Lachnospiraceae bacterium]